MGTFSNDDDVIGGTDADTPPKKVVIPDVPTPQPEAAPPTSVSARFAMPAVAAQQGPPAPAPTFNPADEVAEPDLAQRGIVGTLIHGPDQPVDTAQGVQGMDDTHGLPGQLLENKNAYDNRITNIQGALPPGSKFDPSQGVSKFWDALRLASIDNMPDRAKYLNDNGYKNAQVLDVPGVGHMTVFQGDDGAYHPAIGTDWSMGDVGRAMAHAPQVATQVGTTMASDGASLPARMALQAVTGAGEKGVEELANKAAGTNSGSVASNAANMGSAGLTSSIGELLGSVFGYGKGVATGANKGIFTPSAEGAEALAAADRLRAAGGALPAMTPGAVGSDVLATRERQLAGLTSVLKDHYQKFGDSIGDLMQQYAGNLTGGNAPAVGDAATQVGSVLYPGLQDVVDKAQGEAAMPLLSVPNVEQSQGGSALRQGANALKEGIVARTGAKYDAIPDQGVTFDNTPMQDTIADMEKGLKAKGNPQIETTTTEPDPINAGLTGAKPTTTTVETPTTVTLGEVPGGYVGQIVNKIKQMYPQMEDVEGRTPYEQLQNLRTKLGYAGAEYPVGGTPEQIAQFHQARQLLGSLDNVLANPQGANAAQFATKLKSAQNAATFQNDTLDNPMIQRIRNSQVPPEDMMSYSAPGNFTNLQLLKRTMPPADFQKYQDAWASSLIRNPERIPAALDAYRSDPRSLSLLADPERLQMLTDYSDALTKIQGSPAAKMMAEKNFANRPGMALSSADADGISDLIDRSGGPNSPIGMNLRAAMFHNVMQGGKEMGSVDLTKTAGAADKMLSNPSAQKIMTPDDMQMLKDIRDVSAAQGKTGASDVGASMQRGEIATGISPVEALVRPWKVAKTAGDMLEAFIQAKSWSSKLGSRLMVGTGVTPGATIPQRIAGAVSADALSNQPNKEPSLGKAP